MEKEMEKKFTEEELMKEMQDVLTKGRCCSNYDI